MKRTVFVIAIILAAAVLGAIYVNATKSTGLAFQGQVEAREVDVAAKVAGRVNALRVREGDNVLAGDILFELSSPEITAKMAQATAGRDAAVAMRSKADSGSRIEEIEMAELAWTRAQSQARLAKKSVERLDSLFEEGLITEQKYDEASTTAQAAQDAARAAKAQYDLALNGARVEDKVAAQASVDQAQGRIEEVSAFAAETTLAAPIGGEISQILVDIGELAPVGFPIVTIVDLTDAWVVLNVREDHLVNFQMDAELTGTIPALGDKEIPLLVYYIAPQADFATWRATRYSSGYDIKTFEVRLRPSLALEGLRPGMSVLLNIND